MAVDENGDVVIGKDGQTPMTPKEWVESLREQNRITGLSLMAWAHQEQQFKRSARHSQSRWLGKYDQIGAITK